MTTYGETRLTTKVSQRTVHKYGFYSGITETWLRDLLTQNALGGTTRVSFNKTKGYRPGQFRNNPFGSSTYTLECDDTSILVKASYPQGLLPYRKFVGPVAALFSNRASADTTAIPVVHNSYYEALARQQAVAKLSQPDADIGLMLAEASQTAMLLASPLKLLSLSIPRLIRGIPGYLRRYTTGGRDGVERQTLSWLSNNWMRARYGIVPAMLDADALMRQFDTRLAKPILWRLRKKGRHFDVPITATSQNYVENREDVTWRYTVSTVNKSTVHSNVFYRVNDMAEYNLGQQGRSRYQLANLAWEVVPFSFVVDWAFGVGNWIASRCPAPGIQPLGSTVSTKTERIVSLTLNQAVISLAVPTYSSNQLRLVETKYERIPGASIPDFPLVSPAISNLKRSFDSLSLIWQNMPKLRRK